MNEIYEINQILNCGWRFKVNTMIITVESNNLNGWKRTRKKSHAWLGTFAMTGRNALPIELITSQLESRPLRVPNIPDGGNDMILFNRLVVYSHYLFYTTRIISGAPSVKFRKISVRKTIWDLEFLEHLL